MLWLLVTFWHPLYDIQIKHASLLMKVINLQNLLWYCDCTCPPILRCIALSKVKCLMWKLSGNEVKMSVCILHVLYFPLNSFTWPLHTKDMDLHLHLKWFHIDQITLHHGHLHSFGWNFIHLHVNVLPYLLHMYECLIINPTHVQC